MQVRGAADTKREADMLIVLLRAATGASCPFFKTETPIESPTEAVLGTPSTAKIADTGKSWKDMQLDLLQAIAPPPPPHPLPPPPFTSRCRCTHGLCPPVTAEE